VSQLLVEFFVPIQYTGTLYYILTMKLLLTILLTTSLFAQSKEYNENEIYLSKADSLYYKKFSTETVNGKIYKMSEEGIKIPLGSIKNGKLEGMWYGWYDTGEKSSEYMWTNGKKNGRQLYFFKNGEIYQDSYYEQDSLRSIIEYFEDGKLKAKIKTLGTNKIFYTDMFFKNGNVNLKIRIDTLNGEGYRITNYVDGRKKSHNFYKNFKSHGVDTNFYDDGKYNTVEFKNGVQDGWTRGYSGIKPIYGKNVVLKEQFYENGKVITENDYSAPYHFRLDSLFIHKIADEGTKGYTTAFFNNAYGGIIYKTASESDTLKQIENLKGYKVFPYIRKKGNDYILITNANNESIGYIQKSRISFSNRNHIKEFDSNIRRVRFKYLLD
jgi:antitoxin component YwqK of YwqJK toxin-antitoxin module